MKKEQIVDLLIQWGIENYTVNDDLTVDVDGDVSLQQAFEIKKSREFVFQWGVIKGNFSCARCLLISLEGAPREVHGNFDCSGNKFILLDHSPEIVKGDYLCYNNKSLRSLQGCTRKIGGNFDISNCGIPRLANGPIEVGGDYNLAMNECQTLGGIAKKIGGKIDASQNKLTSVYGTPEGFSEADIDTSGNPINPGDEMERSMWG